MRVKRILPAKGDIRMKSEQTTNEYLVENPTKKAMLERFSELLTEESLVPGNEVYEMITMENALLLGAILWEALLGTTVPKSMIFLSTLFKEQREAIGRTLKDALQYNGDFQFALTNALDELDLKRDYLIRGPYTEDDVCSFMHDVLPTITVSKNNQQERSIFYPMDEMEAKAIWAEEFWETCGKGDFPAFRELLEQLLEPYGGSCDIEEWIDARYASKEELYD